jgi:hypothetical protein
LVVNNHKNGKMEEDVKHEDEDGVDGRGICGWDGWVCGLGAVGASLVFGLVPGAGAFAAVLPSFVLVSNMSFAEHNRAFATSFRQRLLCDVRRWSAEPW